MSKAGHRLPDHPDIPALIPWLLNGTLDAPELDRVNRHIAHCGACANSLWREMALARQVSAAPPAVSRWEGRRRQSLTALQAQVSPGGGIRRVGSESRRYRLPAALAALALTAVGLTWMALPPGDVSYRTLTDPPTIAHGPLLQVVFAPEATERNIRELLSGHGAAVVSGPGTAGVYRIRLSDTADKEAVVASLKRHPATRLVVLER